MLGPGPSSGMLAVLFWPNGCPTYKFRPVRSVLISLSRLVSSHLNSPLICYISTLFFMKTNPMRNKLQLSSTCLIFMTKRRKLYYSSVIGFLLCISVGCNSEKTVVCPNTVADAGNNTYDVVKIGAQCWMGSNLRTAVYANGDIWSLEDWRRCRCQPRKEEPSYCKHRAMRCRLKGNPLAQTSSMIAISALSPRRRTVRMMRV